MWSDGSRHGPRLATQRGYTILPSTQSCTLCHYYRLLIRPSHAWHAPIAAPRSPWREQECEPIDNHANRRPDESVVHHLSSGNNRNGPLHGAFYLYRRLRVADIQFGIVEHTLLARHPHTVCRAALADVVFLRLPPSPQVIDLSSSC
jgi:hypothetical protein